VGVRLELKVSDARTTKENNMAKAKEPKQQKDSKEKLEKTKEKKATQPSKKVLPSNEQTSKEEQQLSQPSEKEAGGYDNDKEVVKESSDTPLAKAGKRSAKSLKEAKIKADKEARKALKEDSSATIRKPKPKIRSRLERRGKKYRNIAKDYDLNKEYTFKDAAELITKLSPVKFDATIEIHVRLGVDPKQAEQNIRASLVLPAGTGRQVRVAVFAEADKLSEAKKAGADLALSDEFLDVLSKSKTDFDILITSPNLMPKLGKFAKLLGPKGLMPNPKSGTVTNDITKAVKEAKSGKVEYRVDQHGIVHLAIGKVSFGSDKILSNIDAVMNSIKNAKPASLKGNYIKSVYLSTTMGPAIKLALAES